MAKKSIEARQRKRERLVAQYADKRKALKDAGELTLLDKLPKNSKVIIDATNSKNVRYFSYHIP